MFFFYFMMIKMSFTHKFHLLSISPWPIILSFSSFLFMMNLLNIFYSFKKNMINLILSILLMMFISLLWWRDTMREHTLGEHSMTSSKNLKYGFILFILSELFLFISLFWTFFHSSINPLLEIGTIWPPKNIKIISSLNIPLLNTMILLSSSISVTISHHFLLNNNNKKSMMFLLNTIILGFIFTYFQLFEYMNSNFSISDSIYGSIFFLATGFHGIHVLIGSLFLLSCLIRMFYFHFNYKTFICFELAIWYWHFVDTIWLFLFMIIY
uniref:Cytochrome c oxidase subunit 3 n=1 Tax=Tremex columba TaxID=222809 RepID=A0A3G5BC61_TRECO|nr:cytochrome c oxidase subunit III [Tremex columba]AYV97235.1 cytochrome c oxidase subunit 3 [Tremex columba]